MKSKPSRTVLITGAARRIGRVLALDFAAHGWNVAVHYKSSDKDADSLIEQIKSFDVDAVALAADLADTSGLSTLVSRCCDVLGPPECLVNNASDFAFDSIESLTEESWGRHLDTNLKAPVFLAQAVARALGPSRTGNIINIIDQRVWRPTPEYFSYTVSKAGLWSATRMLAQALAPRLRVNAIGPGPVLQSVHQRPEDFANEAASTLLGRKTEPEEIAAAIRFILDAPSMTGQMIALDSGQHLQWSSERGPLPAGDMGPG